MQAGNEWSNLLPQILANEEKANTTWSVKINTGSPACMPLHVSKVFGQDSEDWWWMHGNMLSNLSKIKSLVKTPYGNMLSNLSKIKSLVKFLKTDDECMAILSSLS